MVVGINDNSARKKLPKASKLASSQCIDICRSFETSARQVKAINQEEVRFVKEENRAAMGRKNSPLAPKPLREPQGYRMVCKFCARQHDLFAKENCPAWGTACRNCVSLTILLISVEWKTRAVPARQWVNYENEQSG